MVSNHSIVARKCCTRAPKESEVAAKPNLVFYDIAKKVAAKKVSKKVTKKPAAKKVAKKAAKKPIAKKAPRNASAKDAR